jgi:subtilisin family serine protease
MSRLFKTGIAVAAAASVIACSDSSLSPGGIQAPGSVALGLAVGQGNDEQVVPGEVLVKFKSGIDENAKAKGRGLGLLRKGIGGAFVVMRGANGSEHANANSLKNDPDVEWAEPNYIRTTDVIDAKLWAFRNPGGLNMRFTSDNTPIPSSYASILDADEDNVENYAANGADVVVGSIDTGVDMDHQELAGRTIAGTDWISSGGPDDEDGHGTHTSGTMAGTNVGVAGVSGAAAHVKVLVQRVCGPSGCPTSAIINAINAVTDWSIANGNKVVAINMSLGGSSESTGEKTAIQRATNAGILVIASAGNSGAGKVACPACDPNAISVMATNWKDEKASYSQYGKGLDIAAPGGLCYSNTTPEGCIYSSYLNNGYAWLLGTSMAAPQVTGTAAIVASKTGLRGSALRTRIINTTDKPSTLNRYNVGRLNSYRAVTNTSLPAGQ